MGIKKIVDYYVLRKSLKEIEMNRILEKIYKKIKISTKEKRFLDLYNKTTEEVGKDLMFLSKNATRSCGPTPAAFRALATMHERSYNWPHVCVRSPWISAMLVGWFAACVRTIPAMFEMLFPISQKLVLARNQYKSGVANIWVLQNLVNLLLK